MQSDPVPFLELNQDHEAVIIYKMIHNDLDRLQSWCVERVWPYLCNIPEVRLANFWTMRRAGDVNPMFVCAIDNYLAVDWSAIRDYQQHIVLGDPTIFHHPDVRFTRSVCP